MDHLPFRWKFGPALTLPGQEGGRRRQKRPGFHLPFPILLRIRKETRGERDRLAENGGSPHPAKEELPPFLARRMSFCPGRGLLGHMGNPLFPESIDNAAFPERYRFRCSPKLEMIQVLCPWKNLSQPPFHPSCASQKERVIIERRVETMMSEDIRLLSAPSLVERR